jgi:hypothetical protein
MAIPTIITPRQITDIRSSRLAIGGPYVLRATVLALLRFPMTSRGGENGFVLTGGAGSRRRVFLERERDRSAGQKKRAPAEGPAEAVWGFVPIRETARMDNP